MYANLIQDESSDKNYKLPAENKKTITFPAISLVASGGHTELFLMESEKHITWLGGTLDDAAGEAFDKTARLLGFENSGGKAIEKAAQMCTNSYKFSPRNKTIALPRPYLPDQPYNFSFSGLKAAAMRIVNTLKDQKQFNNATIQSCAYEIQESITDVLVKKTINAAKAYKAKFILVSGGVASNMRLRKKFDDAIQRCNQAAAHNPYSELHFSAPPIALCMDNAVSIGACAHFIGSPASVYTITAKPDLPVEVKI
jgi:N6-L-threonylcarbamoyladenine synthase